MFIPKTTDFCAKTLNLVRYINVPKLHGLLGIHPILSVVCGTDDGRSITEILKSLKLNTESRHNLLAVVKYCVHSSIYPHNKTVWAFNEPQSEILDLESYLDGQSFEIENRIRLHSPTYPFIEVEEHYADLPIHMRGRKNPKPVEDIDIHRETEDLPIEESEFVYRTSPTLLVPTLALGSLYVLSKLADTK